MSDAAPSEGESGGPWEVVLLCCGRGDGVQVGFATWDEADAWRQQYVASGDKYPDGWKHERVGIVRHQAGEHPPGALITTDDAGTHSPSPESGEAEDAAYSRHFEAVVSACAAIISGHTSGCCCNDCCDLRSTGLPHWIERKRIAAAPVVPVGGRLDGQSVVLTDAEALRGHLDELNEAGVSTTAVGVDTYRQPQTWDLLAEALGEIKYTRDEKSNSPRFSLHRDDEYNYAVLYIFTHNPNTYRPDEVRHTQHEFVVPVATYSKGTWTRWVFDRIAAIEHHETCESFQVNGVRIYAPHHGNGEDPYMFWPGGTAEQKSKAPGEE